MTASITEQSLTYAFTKFQAIAGATAFRSRVAALALAEGIAIVAEPEEQIETPVSTQQVKREDVIIVRILGRGDVPDSTIDPIRVAVHAALTSDQTLGGLIQRIVGQGSKWTYEEADKTAGQLEIRYKLIYLTPTNSLSNAA